jgi:2-oxoglutarate ferredoxin oxidoreductase subunit gamma
MTVNSLYEEILIAGFGGQGIISAGKLLAYAAMKSGKQVSCMPSYGAEVRGGTANCMVVIAEQPIASPLISKPDSLIAMNAASVSKFTSQIKDGGLLVFNSSLVNETPKPANVAVLPVPADELAVELGDKKVANMVALGAYLQKKNVLNLQAAIDSLPETIAKKHQTALSINVAALKRGAQFAEDYG